MDSGEWDMWYAPRCPACLLGIESDHLLRPASPGYRLLNYAPTCPGIRQMVVCLVYVEKCRCHLRELTARAWGEKEMVNALEMGTMKSVED
jgi:hypothetical protein